MNGKLEKRQLFPGLSDFLNASKSAFLTEAHPPRT